MLSLLDRFLNRLYTSDYNPIYRSGTIAVLLLFMATISGLILIFFYRIGDPHGSITAIQENWWFARWLRAFHRYSSDAMIIATLFHLFRMWAQNKYWGKRTLPWITGVILLLMTLSAAWSGLILVWDSAAQELMLSFTRFIDSFIPLSTPLSIGFDGSLDKPVKSLFFFTLFFHAVVPLAMIFGIWVHTMKLARASWFPKKKLSLLIVGSFVFISLIISAPLDKEANLLAVQTDYIITLPYLFWLPWMQEHAFILVSFAIVLLFLLLLTPFLFSPSKKKIPPPSSLDKDICNGCNQCVVDCPYEAISLVPRLETENKNLSTMHAHVDTSLCVSCALCTASCPVFTIGPKGRTSIDQHKNANTFLKELRQREKLDKKIIIISCTKQPHSSKVLKDLEKKHPEISVFPIECMGTLHMRTIGQMSGQAAQIILAACPERNCSNKDAHMLLKERIAGIRPPSLPARTDKTKIKLFSVGDGEEYKIKNYIQSLSEKKTKKSSLISRIGASLFSLLILSLLALSSQVSIQLPSTNEGILRVSWKLQSQKFSICNQEDQRSQSSLKHMRLEEDCINTYVDYLLKIQINEKQVLEKKISHSGRNKQSALYVSEELKLAEGAQKVFVSFQPILESKHEQYLNQLKHFNKNFNLQITKGKITLIHLDKEEESLSAKNDNKSK